MENVILYNEFHIDFSRSYEEQADSLNEDLFQTPPTSPTNLAAA